MGQDSKIQWTDHTFNPWRGCSKESAGCDNCYAETMSRRNPALLGVWGDDGTRVLASESMWKEPLRWNAEAQKRGMRARVFCASLADVFEWPTNLENSIAVSGARGRLFRLIEATPWLDWLLLTKRPQNVMGTIPRAWEMCLPPNVWVGTSVENQAAADERIPHLLRIPARVRFLSCEPLLGAVDLSRWSMGCLDAQADPMRVLRGPEWVIVGGESGGGARRMHLDWARSLVEQCAAAKVPVFVKQLGSAIRGRGADLLPLNHPKGGDMSEWPADLQIQQFPQVSL